MPPVRHLYVVSGYFILISVRWERSVAQKTPDGRLSNISWPCVSINADASNEDIESSIKEKLLQFIQGTPKEQPEFNLPILDPVFVPRQLTFQINILGLYPGDLNFFDMEVLGYRNTTLDLVSITGSGKTRRMIIHMGHGVGSGMYLRRGRFTFSLLNTIPIHGSMSGHLGPIFATSESIISCSGSRVVRFTADTPVEEMNLSANIGQLRIPWSLVPRVFALNLVTTGLVQEGQMVHETFFKSILSKSCS